MPQNHDVAVSLGLITIVVTILLAIVPALFSDGRVGKRLSQKQRFIIALAILALIGVLTLAAIGPANITAAPIR